MKARSPVTGIRSAACRVLVLATIATLPTFALAADDVTQEMADQIDQRLRLVPAGSSNPVFTVGIEDGMYVINGMVDNTDSVIDARDALRGIEGLDLSLVDIRVIQQ